MGSAAEMTPLKNGNGTASALWKSMEVMIAGLVTVNIALNSWTVGQVFRVSSELSEVRGMNFTARDGQQLEQRIGDCVTRIWQNISEVKQVSAQKADRSELLSPEIAQRMERLEAKVDTMQIQLTKLQPHE